MKKIVLGLGLSVLVACGGAPEGATTTPTNPNGRQECVQYETQIREVWNSEVKAQLNARVSSSGDGDANADGTVGWSSESLHQITTGMDDASEDWARQYMALCNDRQQGVYDGEAIAEYRCRAACLDEWMGDLRTAIAGASDQSEQRFQQSSTLFAQVIEGRCRPTACVGGASGDATGAGTDGSAADDASANDTTAGASDDDASATGAASEGGTP